MSLKTSLTIHGFFCNPWIRNSSLTTFCFGSIDGLIDLRQCLRVISINNEIPGNGDFTRCMEALEKVANENRQPLQVVQIWNDGLHTWLSRRGYAMKGNRELGRYAVFQPAAVALHA